MTQEKARAHSRESSLHGGITDCNRNGISSLLPCSDCQTSHSLDVINCKVATAEEGRGEQSTEGLSGKPAAFSELILEVLCLGAFSMHAFNWQRMPHKQLHAITGIYRMQA